MCCLFSRPSNSRSGSALQVRLTRGWNKTKLTGVGGHRGGGGDGGGEGDGGGGGDLDGGGGN